MISTNGRIEYGGEINSIHEFPAHLKADGDTQFVDWTAPDLERITRLRLISDPGFPVWDVSYCLGILKNGVVVHVQLPFDQLRKKNVKKDILTYAVEDKVYAKGLGLFSPITISKSW